MAITLENTARNAAADAVVDLLDGGAGAGTLQFELSDDTEVATLTFSDPAFGDAATGVATANSITEDSSATGNASAVAQASFYDSTPTKHLECPVTSTDGGGEIEISNTTIAATETVSMSTLTYTQPA